MSDSKAITINSSGELVEALVDDLVDKANINLTAAATMDLYSVTSNTVHISGSGAITSFGTPPRGGARRLVQFTATGITLTHGTGAGSIRLPGLANIVTTLGDYAEFISTDSSAWICTSYTKLDGTAVVSSGGGGGSSNDVTSITQSSTTMDISAITTEGISVTLNSNVTSIVLPAGVANKTVYRSILVTQAGTGLYTISGWAGVAIEGGSAPAAATGVGATTEYMLVNTNNLGWRMYVDQGVPLSHVGAGASAHALATPAEAGFLDPTDKTKLNSLFAPVVKSAIGGASNSAVTPAEITSLSIDLLANATYEINCFLVFKSTATTAGAGIGFNVTAAATNMLEIVVPITSTAAASQLRTLFPSATSSSSGEVLATAVTAINSNHTARISGIIKVGGTGGTFVPRFRSEVAGQTITIQDISTIVARRVG